MATERNQTVHSGNTVLLMVNGTVIGRAQSLQGQRSYGTEGVYEIGDIMPQEHVYLRYEGTITLERLRLKNESLDRIGLAALGSDILTRDVVDIVVMDRLQQNIVVAYRGCTAQNLDETFNANQIASESTTFAYLNSNRVN